MKKIVNIVLLLIAFTTAVRAQEEIEGEESKYESSSTLTKDTLIDVKSMYRKKEEFKEKAKKTKKHVFYGIKTKRAFTKKGSGNRVQTELFFVLKKPQEPNAAVAEIFWFDIRTKKVSSKPITDKLKPYALILHGPYKRFIGKQLVEEGQFYVGAKHGRWELFDKNNILLDKVKYYKGWPKDSKIDYWDPEKKLKIREVLPIVNGEEHGRYVKFYKSGLPEIEGAYKHGRKVGVWFEYYDSKGQKKTESRFHPDSTNAEVVRTWSPKGKETYNKYPDENNKRGNVSKKKGTKQSPKQEDEESEDEPNDIEESSSDGNTDLQDKGAKSTQTSPK